MTTTLQRNHNNQMMPYEEALGGSGKEKRIFNRKKPLRGGRQDKRNDHKAQLLHIGRLYCAAYTCAI